MPDETPVVSLVLPVYGGARFLKASLDKASRWLSKRPGPTELIVVDDGSRDETPTILREHRPRPGAPELRVLTNPVNRGKGFSVRRGLLASRGRYRLFTDADLTYPMSCANDIVEALDAGADIAVACRVHEESQYVVSPDFFRYIYTRHNAGRVFNWLVRTVVVEGVRDTQAGLKGFRADAVQDLLPRLTRDRFSFDVELVFLARKLGYRIEEVPVTYVYCKEASTLSFARDTLDMCADLLRIRLREARGLYDRPAEEALGDAPRPDDPTERSDDAT
jgi:glycosyltransferase involved in cell wall biosynthesis